MSVKPRYRYQESQAWMFATPEEVHGKREIDDSKVWGIVATKPAQEKRYTASPSKENMQTTNKVHPPLIDLVKQTVTQYRMQSATHFALHIDVQLAETGPEENVKRDDKRDKKLKILFQNYGTNIQRACQRTFRKGHATRKVVVREANSLMPLKKMLAQDFPVEQAMVSAGTLQAYWDANGKSFNWGGLPTELKEHIIQFCIIKAPCYPDYFQGILRLPRSARDAGSHPCEVIDRLGKWRGLLLVSTQTRAIALRLCFSGSLVFGKGLCITSNSYPDFESRLNRLARYHQTMEPNSVPNKPQSHIDARRYLISPKLYPELKQYATFMHGIRKIALGFDFVRFYHFFKVTAGGCDNYRPNDYLTYDVLEQLPHLNEIVIRLPKNRKLQWMNMTHVSGPALFHPIFPCVRVIFRLLYERIAVALVAYDNVKVLHFPDKIEEQRFWDLRHNAMNTLKPGDSKFSKLPEFISKEVEELYAANGGGIQLTDQENENDTSNGENEGAEVNPFYPIHCACDVSCREQYDFRR